MENNTISKNIYKISHNIKIQSLQDRKYDLLLSFIWFNSLDGEVWKEIKGYNPNYFISNYGRVLSLCNNGYKLLKQWLANDYYYVDLMKDGVKKHARVNRLVALAFLDNQDNKPLVHHKDGDKKNNNLQNLTFTTYKEHSEAHNEKDHTNNA